MTSSATKQSNSLAQAALDCFAVARNDKRSRDASAPELCLTPRTKNRLASGIKGRRSADRRIVLPIAACAAAHPSLDAPAYRRFTAALATGSYPDGSAPEPGFLKYGLAGVFPLRQKCLELSTLRADRSFCRSTGAPEPPECGLAIPPAWTATRSAFQACRPDKRPVGERRCALCNVIGYKCQYVIIW